MIVGLGGYAGSGKDSLFTLLREKYPQRNYVRYAFADALKVEIAPRIKQEFGLDVFNCTPEEKAKFRHLLVDLGATRRAEDPLYWVKQVAKKIVVDKELDPTITSVITDVRYINEHEFFRANGPRYKLVVINRFGNQPANEEEARYTKPLYELQEADTNMFFWDNLEKYAKEDVDTLLDMIDNWINND